VPQVEHAPEGNVGRIGGDWEAQNPQATHSPPRTELIARARMASHAHTMRPLPRMHARHARMSTKHASARACTCTGPHANGTDT
jgi:hypothetical protein